MLMRLPAAAHSLKIIKLQFNAIFFQYHLIVGVNQVKI